ncbi:sensor histidine kinase [Kineococcus auxinigenes]|uniref:sensor histidine kinase n=1 Tax=unclassified Kineococcus TaxID=2621656 RepID=UPI003D7EA73D
MPLRPGTPARTEVAVPGAVCLVAVTALLLLVPAVQADPEAGAGVPQPGSAAWWSGIAVVVAQALVLARRRAHPRLVLGLVAAGVPVAALAGLGEVIGTTSVAVLVAAYTATVVEAVRRTAPALGLAAVLVGVGTLIAQPADGAPILVQLGAPLAQALGIVVLPASAGVVVGSRREAAQARARQVEALSREHGARVEAAVARERAAMARELHDIAAHHLSGIAVMTGAIGRQIDVDPAAAKVAVQRVRAETSAMLEELRTLVRLLRDAPEDTERPVETLAAVPALVERARAAGVDATLTVLGSPAEQWGAVGPLAQLAAFRTVQECLANVVRHAPGARCEVVLDAKDPAVFRVSVVNGPPPAPVAPLEAGLDARPGGGLGLVGMQERADLTDALLHYGPEPGGGWRVTLGVPTQREAEAPRPSARVDGAAG